MRIPAFFFLLIALNAGAQEQQDLSGRFIKGMISGSDAFSIRAVSTVNGLTFNSNENHGFASEVGYGWFSKGRRSIYFGLGTSLSQTYTRQLTQWSNSFNGVAELGNYKNIYHNRLFFCLTRSFQYTYTYGRQYVSGGYYVSNPNPNTVAHSLNFRLKPGVLFQYSNALIFIVNLELINIGLSMNESYSYTEPTTTTTRYSYNLLSNYSASSLQIGVLWKPALLQAKQP